MDERSLLREYTKCVTQTEVNQVCIDALERLERSRGNKSAIAALKRDQEYWVGRFDAAKAALLVVREST